MVKKFPRTKNEKYETSYSNVNIQNSKETKNNVINIIKYKYYEIKEINSFICPIVQKDLKNLISLENIKDNTWGEMEM